MDNRSLVTWRLLFGGQGPARNEMFLRWLMNERAPYFRNLGVLGQPSWYSHVHAFDDERDAGKLFLLEDLGISYLRGDDHAATYRNPDSAV